MNTTARRIVNYITIGLLVGAGFALFTAEANSIEDSLGPALGILCLETDSAFYAGQCPGNEVAASDALIVASDVMLTDDHHGPITITSDNVTLDCAGHAVVGPGSSGIRATGQRNVTIENCIVIGFEIGIELQATEDSQIHANTAEANGVGYTLTDSDGNELHENAGGLNRSDITLSGANRNKVSANSFGNGPGHIWVVDSDNNTFTANEFASRAIVAIDDGTGNVVTDNTFPHGGDIRMSGAANEVSDNEIRSGVIRLAGEASTASGNLLDSGSLSVGGTGHTVTDNVINSTADMEPGGAAIRVRSSDSDISSNVVSGGTTAFAFDQAHRNTVSDNRAVGSSTGFLVNGSRANTFSGNDASEADLGLDGLAPTVDNVFEDNVGFNITEPLVVAADLTLDSDREGTIVIDADGVTLDCAGHNVVPATWTEQQAPIRFEVAIQIREHTGVTVENCDVVGYERGIALWKADGNTIRTNTAAIYLAGSDDNSISANVATIELNRSHGNTVADNVSPSIRLTKSNRNAVEANTVNGIALSGGDLRVSGRRNTVTSNVVTGNLVLTKAINNTMANNEVTGGQVRVALSSENTVRDNSVAADRGAAFLVGQVATNNVFEDNTARGAKFGFKVYNSEGNTFSGNVTVDNDVGFALSDARRNAFTANDASGSETGLNESSQSQANIFTDNVGF